MCVRVCVCMYARNETLIFTKQYVWNAGRNVFKCVSVYIWNETYIYVNQYVSDTGSNMCVCVCVCTYMKWDVFTWNNMYGIRDKCVCACVYFYKMRRIYINNTYPLQGIRNSHVTHRWVMIHSLLPCRKYEWVTSQIGRKHNLHPIQGKMQWNNASIAKRHVLTCIADTCAATCWHVLCLRDICWHADMHGWHMSWHVLTGSIADFVLTCALVWWQGQTQGFDANCAWRCCRPGMWHVYLSKLIDGKRIWSGYD